MSSVLKITAQWMKLNLRTPRSETSLTSLKCLKVLDPKKHGASSLTRLLTICWQLFLAGVPETRGKARAISSAQPSHIWRKGKKANMRREKHYGTALPLEKCKGWQINKMEDGKLIYRSDSLYILSRIKSGLLWFQIRQSDKTGPSPRSSSFSPRLQLIFTVHLYSPRLC